MGAGWYVIRVELRSGGDQGFDLPPGRDLLVSSNHSFGQLADAINMSFARWDLGHQYVYRFGDGTEVGTVDDDGDVRDASRSKIARLDLDEVFEFEFDFGDSWIHRCTVREVDVDPDEQFGAVPLGPVAVLGWGMIPDQYGMTTPDG